jgi:hypothetical protein
MRGLAGIYLLLTVAGLTAASNRIFAQSAALSERWSGTWVLSLPESKIDKIFGPGVPAGGLTLTGQTWKITVATGRMKTAVDTVFAELGTIHEEDDQDLNGQELVQPGGAKIQFKRINDWAFDDIVSTNSEQLGNHVGENHFVFSADGKTLTETKIHIEREVMPEGKDPAKGKVLRTSNSVLVFHRVPDAK